MTATNLVAVASQAFDVVTFQQAWMYHSGHKNSSAVRHRVINLISINGIRKRRINSKMFYVVIFIIIKEYIIFLLQ